MRCGCPECGTYMVQREQGLMSGCVCPACFYACRDCMGSDTPPAALDELAFHAMLRERLRREQEESD